MTEIPFKLDGYDFEVLREPRECGGELVVLDEDRTIARLPGHWTKELVEAYLRGREDGLECGEEFGRRMLQIELRKLLNAAPQR